MKYAADTAFAHASQEYFADYAPVLPSLFSLNHQPSTSRPLYGNSANSWDPGALERAVQGVTAVLLSLKKKPIIRYEKSSPMAKKLGVEIQVCAMFFFDFAFELGRTYTLYLVASNTS